MWRVHLENLIRFGSDGYRMYVAREHPSGGYDLLIKPTLKGIGQHASFGIEDAFMDDGMMPDSDVRAFLQAMSDAAWDIGIKPKQIEDHTSELAAVRYHLEDMRTLALK